MPAKRSLAPIRGTRQHAAVALSFDQIRIEMFDDDGERVSVIYNSNEVERLLRDIHLARTDSMRMDLWQR